MTCELTSAEYPDIRAALGLAGDDTAGLPDETIEARLYLPRVTRRVQAALAAAGDSCAFSCDDGDPDYDEEKAEAMLDALALLTAAEIAAGWFAARADGRITSEGLGSLRVSYDKTEWLALASRRRAEGLASLQVACPDAAAALAGAPTELALMSVDGPSRSCKSAAAKTRVRERELEPWGLGGP